MKKKSLLTIISIPLLSISIAEDIHKIDLGTLRDDNSGYSEALGVSADGKVVVGHASTNSFDRQAFKHIEGQNKMIGLGTLRDDNLGTSYAYGVSADGKVVVGNADTNSVSRQAFKHIEGQTKMIGGMIIQGFLMLELSQPMVKSWWDLQPAIVMIYKPLSI